MVYDIVKADNPIKIVTNAGTRIVSEQAMVAGFGTVWFDEQAIANIFALADLKKKYHVTYDPAIEDAFIVHRESKQPLKFRVIPRLNLTKQSKRAPYTMSLVHPPLKITRHSLEWAEYRIVL